MANPRQWSIAKDLSMSSKLVEYLERRIKQLRAEHVSDEQIVERLSAVADSKKQLRQLIARLAA